MNPAPHSRQSDIQQQLAVLLDRPARHAGLRPRLGIFNLGEPDDYRVPDAGLLRPGEEAVYLPAAALVVEIVSPDDETWDPVAQNFAMAGDAAGRGIGESQVRRSVGRDTCCERKRARGVWRLVSAKQGSSGSVVARLTRAESGTRLVLSLQERRSSATAAGGSRSTALATPAR
jgi:hypothetical protein